MYESTRPMYEQDCLTMTLHLLRRLWRQKARMDRAAVELSPLQVAAQSNFT